MCTLSNESPGILIPFFLNDRLNKYIFDIQEMANEPNLTFVD